MSRTMQGFSLWQLMKNYFERRGRAAAVARQRVKDPHFVVTSWVERKLQFDRQFRILMRTNYFWCNAPMYSGQNTVWRIGKWLLVMVAVCGIAAVLVAVVRSTLVANQQHVQMEQAMVHCLNGGTLDAGDGVRVICVAAR